MVQFTKFFILICIFFTQLAHARLIRIIHTNDLHSYFTGYTNGGGGYARVKSKLHEIREQSAREGIEVVHLDAGDWGEGTSFYHVNGGVNSIRALELLGIDVATIGNHDHMMGPLELSLQIREANVRTKFTVANVVTTPEMKLKGLIVPYVDMEKGGIPLRVIGLTTSSLFFQYTMVPGKILSPYKVGENEAKRGKKAGRELVIALTHIGLKDDIKLAKKSSNIDIIVGGHSHTKMEDILWEKNKKGKLVPIVQAWAHGLGVGSLLVEVTDDGKVNVLDYQLHEVDERTPEDSVMLSYVNETVAKRNQSFPFNWNEVIGFSDTPITGYISGHPVHRKSCWGYHMATAIKDAVGASIGVHASPFEGVYKSSGPVTYGDIADHYPHFRKYGDAGWEIATVKVPGWELRPIMRILSKLDVGVTFSGAGYNEDNFKSAFKVEDKLYYTLAFPAEVAFAIKTKFPYLKRLLYRLKFTGKYYWPVMADYVKRNSPITCR